LVGDFKCIPTKIALAIMQVMIAQNGTRIATLIAKSSKIGGRKKMRTTI
jgi:hypothetical protein